MKKLIIVLVGVLLLLPYSVGAADLKYGMKNNEEVRQLQQNLKDQKIYFGNVTGNFYSLTLAAVKKFQKANKLKVTGVWNDAAQEKMNEILAIAIPEVDTSGIISNNEVTYSPTPVTQPMVPTISQPQPQPIIPIIPQPQTVVSNPSGDTMMPTSSPTSSPMDTTPPKVIFNRWSNVKTTYDIERKSLGSDAVSWYIGGRTGNQDDVCENCFVVRTDEPTKLKVEYLEGEDRNTFNPATNTNTVKMFEDTTLTNTHIIMLKNYLKPFRSIYTFGYTVTDAFGNETKDPLLLPWNSGRVMSYDPSINDSYTNINNVRTDY